jgi:hypothetical protein
VLGYNLATLSVGGINTETWSSGLGVRRKAKDPVCKRIIVAKCREVKTGCNMVESSGDGCGSKEGCFANGVGGGGHDDDCGIMRSRQIHS